PDGRTHEPHSPPASHAAKSPSAPRPLCLARGFQPSPAGRATNTHPSQDNCNPASRGVCFWRAREATMRIPRVRSFSFLLAIIILVPCASFASNTSPEVHVVDGGIGPDRAACTRQDGSGETSYATKANASH